MEEGNKAATGHSPKHRETALSREKDKKSTAMPSLIVIKPTKKEDSADQEERSVGPPLAKNKERPGNRC